MKDNPTRNERREKKEIDKAELILQLIFVVVVSFFLSPVVKEAGKAANHIMRSIFGG
ncbi:hypothetical protein ACVR1G_08305 [Streptococcus dentasini]